MLKGEPVSQQDTLMLYLDLETYSETDLRKAGVYRYVEDPAFEILMAGWSDGGPVQVAVGESEILAIPGLTDLDTPIVAHNANFDRTCLSTLTGFRHSYLPPERFIDTMALAAEHGLPRGLADLAKALKVDPKDSAGTRLINLFSKPYRGRRVHPEDKPEQWQQFVDYCAQDVRTLIEVHKALPDFPTETERRLFHIDQRINDRGIKVDLELAGLAVAAAEQNMERHKTEVERITGVANGNSVSQLLAWFKEQGIDIGDLRAETVQSALTYGLLSEDQMRVLELRQHLALAASKKFTAAIDATCSDGRFRGGFQFYGAHTGRWSGRKIQLHNLPRQSSSKSEAEILDLKLGLGGDDQTLKGLVRSMLTGPFTVADYSAIEARVLAWLAGEKWVLRAFEHNRDIYVETANRMGGLSRQQGKVAVLALGYGGSVGSLRVMGAEGDDEELEVLVAKWRDANPNIRAFWDQLKTAVLDGGKAGRIHVVKDGKTRHLILPSGRALVMHGVVNRVPLPHHAKPWDDGKKRTLYYTDYARGGAPYPTYGGRLCIAGDTLVLTERGWVELWRVRADDLVWDGVKFVAHGGLEHRGRKEVIHVEGVYMTPDHQIMQRGGWREAQQYDRSDWQGVGVPNSCGVLALGDPKRWGWVEADLDGALYLWNRNSHAERGGTPWTPWRWPEVVRVSGQPVDLQCDLTDGRRQEQTPFVQSVAHGEVPMHETDGSSVGELRRSRNPNVRRVVLRLLAVRHRHGIDMAAGIGTGSNQQRRRLRTKQLSLDDTQGPSEQPTRRVGETKVVYDLLNCGPRRRFTILTEHGPLLVHNCENVTQAVARDVLAEALICLEDSGYEVAGHVHDEVIVYGTDLDGVVKIVEQQPSWAAGLPLAAEGFVTQRYRKA